MRTTHRLLLSSALMLFLELALIRWLGSNVLHLSYFSNFVLLGSFLGIGLGFLVARTDFSMIPWSPVILALLVAFVRFAPVKINRTSSDIIYFTSTDATGPPVWITLPLIFIAVAVILIGPAEAVGRCFKGMDPLSAYRIDLMGSIVGILAFTAMSFLRAPSVAWGVIVALAFVALLLPDLRVPGGVRVGPGLGVLAAAFVVLLLGAESAASGITWSPYYKVKTAQLYSPAEDGPRTRIDVNGVPHQEVRTVEARLRDEPQYRKAYERFPNNTLNNVLIVGAGSGGDVAIALSKGAKHVDAVEIDPRMYQIGREIHPNQPYADPNVDVHINDGRAFLEQSDTKYDLILFALPDSLVLVNGASAIRLESFLFTKGAVEAAKDHLAVGGGFSMYNYYRENRLIDRLGGTLADVFGHDPCVDRIGGAQAVISAGITEADQSCNPDEPPLAAKRTAPATDDRPFVYFFGNTLPRIYLGALAAILLVSLLLVRALAGPFTGMRSYVDLFFMGAAFLLLETKNVSSFALLFGTTWVVNAIVFTGVLLAVLLAVEVTRRFKTPPLPVVYAGIAAALLLAYAVPNSALLSLGVLPRLIAAVALAFTPVFLANVAFSKRFAVSDDSRAAFAVNILGAMVGGCLEYLGLLTGYRNLLILAGLLYLAAFLLTPKRGSVAVAA
ncbi:MAG: hypothetical protein ABIM89_00430 [Mycobacteriales bacterium]